MRLKRVEVVRFGRLESASLGDLTEGLNIVVGPNEAGKTSLVNLVRQVLFGFVGKKKEESAYFSSAGKRTARLIFTDGDGEWSVERTEGSHGGPVRISTLNGLPHPGLLEHLTLGVSAKTYRVVFGFGVSELARIEDGRASGDGVLSRLYAAQTGSAVSPADVKKEFDKEAAALKTEYNRIKKEINGLSSEIVGLEVAAAAFVQERQRLDGLGSRLQEAQSAREEAQSAFHGYSVALERLESGKRQLEEVGTEQEEYEAEHDEKVRQLQRIVIDQRVAEKATQLEAVLDDLSGFRQRLDALRGHDRTLATLGAEAGRILSEAALDPAYASAADIGPDTVAGLEGWRARLAEAQAACNLSSSDADDAELAAACEVPQAAAAASSMSPNRLPAVAMLVAGLLLTIVGLIPGEMLIAVAGIALAVLGAGMYRWLARLDAAGVPAAPVAGELERQAAVARKKADSHVARMDAMRAEWREWLTARGLAFAGEDPKAVSIVVEAIRQWRNVGSEIEKVRAVKDEDDKWCKGYKERLMTVAGEFMPELQDAALENVPTHAAALRKRLEETVSAIRASEVATRDAERLKGLVETAEKKRARLVQGMEDALTGIGLTMGEGMKLHALVEDAEEALRQSNEEHGALLQEQAALTQKLDVAGKDSTMSQKRLQLTGAQERRAELVERYAVFATAARLIARTQDHHRHARQPEVIRKAGGIFARITGGKYTGIAAPDEGEFIVFDQQAEAVPSSELSTGTVQQLYLALRFALIETLDGIGEGLPVLMDDILVNSDPGRRERTAEAISELSDKRQLILFTCHPDTADLFERVCPGITRIDL